MLKNQKPPPSVYYEVLKTVGDHLRRYRFEMQLLKREVAQKLIFFVHSIDKLGKQLGTTGYEVHSKDY